MIKKIELKAVTGEQDNKFVGIRIKENNVLFCYPQSYNLSEMTDELNFKKDVISILRTIALSKSSSSDTSSYNTKNSNLNNSFAFASFIWILNDYLKYNRYDNKEKVTARGQQGKINWKKTFQTTPIISNGNIVYTSIFSDKKRQEDNILTEIYNCCVNRAIDCIGWLYEIPYNMDGLSYKNNIEKKKKLYLNVLNTELSHTNNDIKKTRLQNMKNIIIGLDSNIIESNEIVYGVDSYNYIYERMVDSLFSNINNIKDFYPNAEWNFIYDSKKANIWQDSSKLRPDTILIDKEKNDVYIIDSKNYQYGTTFDKNSAPTSSDIQKQITYGEYIKNSEKFKINNYNDIYNAFVMPYNKSKNTKNLKKNIEFVGAARAKWLVNDPTIQENQKYKKIAAILIDMKFLIENWTNYNKDNLSDLIKEIRKITNTTYE